GTFQPPTQTSQHKNRTSPAENRRNRRPGGVRLWRTLHRNVVKYSAARAFRGVSSPSLSSSGTAARNRPSRSPHQLFPPFSRKILRKYSPCTPQNSSTPAAYQRFSTSRKASAHAVRARAADT